MKRPDVSTPILFQVLAIALGLISAVTLGRDGFVLTPEMMLDLASTNWDYSAAALKGLAGQANDTRVGTFFLVLSVLFQLLSLRPAIEKPSKSGSRNAVLIATAIAIVSWLIGGAYADAQARKMVKEAEAIWAARSESK